MNRIRGGFVKLDGLAENVLELCSRGRAQFFLTERALDVKSILPTTENWLRKRYIYSMKNDKSTEDEHETNHINNKCNDMTINTRKMHVT